MNSCAHFGYTRHHPLPTNGDRVGDVAPPDAPPWGGGGSLSSPKLYPGILQQNPHHRTLWVLLWMLMMHPAVMNHRPMYGAWRLPLWKVTARTGSTVWLLSICPTVLLPSVEDHDRARSPLVNAWHAYTVPVCCAFVCYVHGVCRVFYCQQQKVLWVTTMYANACCVVRRPFRTTPV